MKKLKKYALDANKTLAFIESNIKGLNTLSFSVLQKTPFSQGTFYAMLREGLTDEYIHGFTNGYVGGGVREKVTEVLHKELIKSEEGVCIFDDYDAAYNPDSDWDVFKETGVFFNKEVYYVVLAKNATKKRLLECFHASDCIWHSLVVFSKEPFQKRMDQTITERELVQIATSAFMIFVLAYDEEGYIIWERNP